MDEKKINTLTECLFILVDSFNTIIDRLDTLTDRNEVLYEQHQELIRQNQEAFKLAREDFLRRIIEEEVNNEIEKSKIRANPKRRNLKNRKDGRTGRKIAFNITSGCKGNNT